MTRLRLLIATLALAAAVVPAAAQEGITVYTAQHAALTQEWADAFTAETGIPVAIRKGTDILMANQIVQEGLNSPADVFLTENSPAMAMVEQAGEFSVRKTSAGELRPSCTIWLAIRMSVPLRMATGMPVWAVKASAHSWVSAACWAV